mmetsp:Transcript_14659/g.16493  ORF Transcript_14659/g.16493 Transcript_14659/m.16493 type:complete len:487 (+) Transcript_14659:74-1534(+)
MVVRSLVCCSLLIVIQLTAVIIASTAFVVDLHRATDRSRKNNTNGKRSWCHRAGMPIITSIIRRERRNINHYRYSSSLELSKGFGRTASVKKASSSGKKKKRKKNSNSKAPPLAYNPDESGSTKLLLKWLDEEEVEGLEGVEIGFRKKKTNNTEIQNGDTLLRGVFARCDYQAGEYIMAVPFVSTLLVDEDFEVSSDDDDDSIDDSFQLGTGETPNVGLRFWQKFLKSEETREDKDIDNESLQRNKYKAYLECIPMTSEDPNFDGTPSFWSKKEIEQLEIPYVVENMLSRKQAITELIEKQDKNNGNDVPTSISFLQQACWIIQTRAFTTYKKAIDLDGNLGLLSRVVLIPFLDMLNHASRSNSNAEIQVIETKEYNESFYALVANKHIQKGTEIKISYGTGSETSLELFCKYGFLLTGDDGEIENLEREKDALRKILLLPEGKNMTWSSSLQEDQDLLNTEIGRKEPMNSILSLRIYAKTLLPPI